MMYARMIVAVIIFAAFGCGQNPSTKTSLESYPPHFSTANLRVNLTDKPFPGVEQVHVNIDRIELLLSGGGKKARLQIGVGLGDVDLLTLRDGVLLPVSDIDMPAGISVHEIRLVLKDSGHYIVKTDGSTCQLQTPSGQQSGVKIKMREAVSFETQYDYSMVIDFDVDHSLVLKGNDECLLKPVLKLPFFTKRENDSGNDDGTTDPGTDDDGTPVTDGDDTSEDTPPDDDVNVNPDGSDVVIDPEDLVGYFPVPNDP